MIIKTIIYFTCGLWRVIVTVARIILILVLAIPLLLIYLGGGEKTADQILAFIWGMTPEELHIIMGDDV